MPNPTVLHLGHKAARCGRATWAVPLARARRWMPTLGFVIGTLLNAASASAEVVVEYWIGRPTMADYIRYSAVSALRSAQQYGQAVAQGEADMAKARTAFFQAKPEGRKAAGDEFGNMLFAKDLMLAMPYLSNGYSDHTAASTRLLSALGGGKPFDGGIRPTANQAYHEWIRSMRHALGARREDDLVIATQPKLMSALEASQGAYAAYRKERDLAEYRAWQGLHPAPSQREGQRPLQRAGQATTLRDVLSAQKLQPGMADEIGATDRGGPRLLACRYGPSYDTQGREYVVEQYFWAGELPENLQRLVAFDRAAMDRVGFRVVKACPTTEAAADQVPKAPMAFTVPQALKDEVEARRQQQRDEDAQRAATAREGREKMVAAAKAREDERRQRSLDAAQVRAAEMQARVDQQAAEARARREQQIQNRDALRTARFEAHKKQAAQRAAEREGSRSEPSGTDRSSEPTADRRAAVRDRREAQQRYQDALRQCRAIARAAGDLARDAASRCRDDAMVASKLR